MPATAPLIEIVSDVELAKQSGFVENERLAVGKARIVTAVEAVNVLQGGVLTVYW
jgi:hypothetical protein